MTMQFVERTLKVHMFSCFSINCDNVKINKIVVCQIETPTKFVLRELRDNCASMKLLLVW